MDWFHVISNYVIINFRYIIIKYLSIVYTLAQSKEKETSKFHKDLLGFLGKGLSRSFSDTKVKRR